MTQTTDAALARQLRAVSKQMREHNPGRGGFNPVMPHEHTLDQAADTIEAQARRIEALEGALRECADDLEVEVAERYKGCGDHPAIAPKVERDMAPVEAARALLSMDPTP